MVFHTDELDQETGRRRIAERLANSALKQTEYDTPEHYSVEVYNMGVFHYEGLYIGLPSIYHHTGKVPPGWPGFDKLRLSPTIRGLIQKYGDYTGFYHIQLAISHDLDHWQRVADRQPFLEASPLGAGAYDIQTIIGPSAPVVRGDEEIAAVGVGLFFRGRSQGGCRPGNLGGYLRSPSRVIKAR